MNIKIGKVSFNKITYFGTSKDTYKNERGARQDIAFVKQLSDEGFVCGIEKELLQISNKTTI